MTNKIDKYQAGEVFLKVLAQLEEQDGNLSEVEYNLLILAKDAAEKIINGRKR